MWATSFPATLPETSCVLSCIVYSHFMNTATLTIRLPLAQREALKRTAKTLKKTESEYIRDLVARDLDEIPFGERVGHLAGCLSSAKASSAQANPFKERIRANNWRK